MKIPLTPTRFLYRAVDLYGSKTGIVSGADRFTYAQFGDRCERLASALLRWGVRPGEPVAFLSYNTHRLLEGYFGVPMANGAVMPLNVRLTASELGDILRHSGARLLFYENEFAGSLETLSRTAGALREAINLDDGYEAFLSSGDPGRIDFMTCDEDSMAELFYTSGSMGTPKGVALTHRTIYLHALGISTGCRLADTDVELHTIPLFHANGWGRPQTAAMMGSKQVLVRRFDPVGVCRLIQEEGATSLSLVPTMANALLAYIEPGHYNFSSLRQVFIGGAASSPELIGKMERLLGCEVLAGYGLTETSPVATTARDKCTISFASPEERWLHKAMAGWPLPGTEIRVVDSREADVPKDGATFGEVIIRGDNVMESYYREPEATADVMTGGWFHTGDMAVWDSENRIRIVDRKKEIIISGGENISSIEVERAIAMHPNVAEVAVVAAPDEVWGEVPVAFVVLVPNRDCSATDLRAFLDPHLAKFKMPRRFEFSFEPLPKGGTGKILKRELKNRLISSP